MYRPIATLLLATAVWAQKPVYPHRWVFIAKNLSDNRHVEEIRDIARTASEHGLNGIVLSAGLDSITRQNAAYLVRLSEVQQICRDHNLELVPQIFSAGYGGGVLGYDRNLAEGLAVRDALFIARNGEARLESDHSPAIQNGSVEDYDGHRARGYNLQDNPGEISFIDTETVQDGYSSLRFENFTAHPAGNARLMQEIPVKPYRQYRVTFWARTEGMPDNTLRFQVLTTAGVAMNPWDARMPGNSPWRKLTWGFNSLSNERVRLYFGVWAGRAGKFWLDDLRIEEVGLLNVLRRPGTPLVVRSDESESVYEESRDFQPVRDPLLNFRFDHDAPAIRLPAGSQIRDGERLRVSYYHGMSINDGQVSVCMSEPAVYDYWRAQAARLHEVMGSARYLLSMDEIRLGGSCESCKRRGLSMAQILGGAVTQQFDMIRGNNPDADVWIWSDMLDPNHNAKNNYYLVEGDYTGSWNFIPREMGIMCWYYAMRRPSLKHFSDLGHRTAAGAYYDADTLDNPRGWLAALDETPNAVGIMYTTWQSKYGLLGPFGDLVSQPRE